MYKGLILILFILLAGCFTICYVDYIEHKYPEETCMVYK